MHVLSTPPAFILSQDQTLRCIPHPFDQFSIPIKIHHLNSHLLSSLSHVSVGSLSPISPLGVTVGASFSRRVQRVLSRISSLQSLPNLRSGRTACFGCRLRSDASREKGFSLPQPPSSTRNHSWLLAFLTGPHTFTAFPSDLSYESVDKLSALRQLISLLASGPTQ